MKLKPSLPDIDLVEYGIGRNAILGIPDSGKSYAAKLLGELLMGRAQPEGKGQKFTTIPFIAFDPTGVWPYLRTPGKGPGYPVVVAGGAHADLPLNPAKIADLIRAAMESNISLVVDLYDPKLSKAEWRRIVTTAAEVLLYENKDHGLRHIFLEEAAEFVPQKVSREYGQVYAALEKIARMGRNAGLGLTVINQRAEEVNKAVLELCDTLFLFKQRGRRSLEALSKWLDFAEVDEHKEIIKSIPQLKQGECWMWLKANQSPRHMQFALLDSFHPNARMLHGEAPAAAKRKPVDVGSFVEAMKDKMAARDPKGAPKTEIVTLKSGAAAKEEAWGGEKARKALEAAEQRGYQRGVKAAFPFGFKAGWTACVAKFGGYMPEAPKQKIPQELLGATPAPVAPAMPAAARPQAAPVFLRASAGDGTLPPGERTALIAIAQFNGMTRTKLSAITGYATSTRNAYLQKLAAKGFIVMQGDVARITADGEEVLGQWEPLPTGAELLDWWLARLKPGESAVLKEAIAFYPAEVSREEVRERTGFAVSTTNAYIQHLAIRDLVVTTRNGLKASEDLF